MARVLVTGAEGNAGRALRALLQERGMPYVSAVRRLSSETRETQVVLDFLVKETWPRALDGIDRIFLLRPPAVSNTKETLVPFVELAWRRGVRSVVFLSVVGAGENPLVPHHAVEQCLQRSNGLWTLLRPGFFCQNLGDAYLQDLRDQRRLFLPAGRGRTAFVDVRDVSEAALLALENPERHHQHAYTLTGPELLDFDDVARITSEELGVPVQYEPCSVFAYVQHLRSRGLPMPQIAVQTILHTALRYGTPTVDPTLAMLLSRAPRSLRTYVRAHRSLWMSDASK